MSSSNLSENEKSFSESFSNNLLNRSLSKDSDSSVNYEEKKTTKYEHISGKRKRRNGMLILSK